MTSMRWSAVTRCASDFDFRGGGVGDEKAGGKVGMQGEGVTEGWMSSRGTFLSTIKEEMEEMKRLTKAFRRTMVKEYKDVRRYPVIDL
jgi:hypothetical protein